MTSPSGLLISSTRLEEGHHDRVTVWNRGGNAGTLTVRKGDGAEVAARLSGGAELTLKMQAEVMSETSDAWKRRALAAENARDTARARVAELEQLLADRDALDAVLTRSAAAEIRSLRDALVEIVRVGTPGVAEIAAAALGRVFP